MLWPETELGQADSVFSGISTFGRIEYHPCLASDAVKYDIAFIGKSTRSGVESFADNDKVLHSTLALLTGPEPALVNLKLEVMRSVQLLTELQVPLASGRVAAASTSSTSNKLT